MTRPQSLCHALNRTVAYVIMRLIINLIRTGVVTEVDRENWLCRVKTGDLETNWINWLTLRAGNARTWWVRGKNDIFQFGFANNIEVLNSEMGLRPVYYAPLS